MTKSSEMCDQGHRKWLELTCGRGVTGLAPGALWTGRYILMYVCPHPGPPEALSKDEESAGNSWVDGQTRGVCPLEDLGT